MLSQRLRDDYLELLFDNAWAVRYPSPNMLDRIEARLRNRQDAEAFANLLMEKAGRANPSPNMIDRLDRVIARVERAEAVAELQEQLG